MTLEQMLNELNQLTDEELRQLQEHIEKRLPGTHTLFIVDPRLKAPLDVSVERTDDDLWLITHPQLLVHGAGVTETEAVAEFVEMLGELWDDLTDSEDILADHLRDDLAYLRTILAQEL